MPAITSENRDFWQTMANNASRQRPYVGRQVTIIRGKHKGKSGKVIRHQTDRYVDAFRYGGEASNMLTSMEGRRGYVCLIDTGTEKVWAKGNYLDCLGTFNNCTDPVVKGCKYDAKGEIIENDLHCVKCGVDLHDHV